MKDAILNALFPAYELNNPLSHGAYELVEVPGRMIWKKYGSNLEDKAGIRRYRLCVKHRGADTQVEYTPSTGVLTFSIGTLGTSLDASAIWFPCTCIERACELVTFYIGDGIHVADAWAGRGLPLEHISLSSTVCEL
jgi:hypothetical protein